MINCENGIRFCSLAEVTVRCTLLWWDALFRRFAGTCCLEELAMKRGDIERWRTGMGSLSEPMGDWTEDGIGSLSEPMGDWTEDGMGSLSERMGDWT
jgi:hypothetical protein